MKLRRSVLPLLPLAIATAAYAQEYPPKPERFVRDDADVLTEAHEDSIRAVLAELLEERDVVGRVFTVPSFRDFGTGDETIESFATSLFNHWGAGNPRWNRGVILLVAVEDRKVRIEVGDAFGAELDAPMRRVVDERILPRFREERYSGGTLAGVQGIAAAVEAWSTGPAEAPPPPAPAYTPPARPAYEPYTPGPSANQYLLPVLGLAGGLLALAFYRHHLRYRARKCEACGTQMARLEEHADDVYLDSGRKVEEFLGSVDYDVWRCGSCGRHSVLPYRALLSGVRDCPGCRYRTLTVRRRTLEHPTEYSSGRQLVEMDCRHCGHHDEDVVHLPRIERSHSGSSFSSSSSGSSFGGGSGGGSSGHSSGHGASGSW